MTIDNDSLVLEAIVTTVSPNGSMHVAPMGPHVDRELRTWTLRPFQTSKTFANLRQTNRCIVHIADDAILIAKAVLGRADDFPARPCADRGFVLESVSHWYALDVLEWDVEQPRATAHCKVVEQGVTRPFFGWNRAKHAVVELAILTSRVHMLDRTMLENEIDRLRTLVDKTGGQQEREAFELLAEHIQHANVSGGSSN